MDIFGSILNQMIFLFAFIAIGFILSKWKFVPDNAAKTISKLENIIFVPALVMSTFIENCTIEVLSSAWKLLVLGFAMVFLLIPISFLLAKFCFKENYLQKIATYGLAFSNFGFMGNAIMKAVFPEIFFEYTVFTLPFWFMIYLWGAPVLLISGSNSGEKVKFSQRIKSFLNPMMIAMFIGLILGLTGLGKVLPTGILSVIEVSGECMSPLAMLLTGITIGQCDVLALLKKWRIYLTTAIKLVVYPLIFLFILFLLPQNDFFTATFFKCAACVAAMPMGLNTIVIPAAYGKDTSDAAGLALISHLFSVGTIPLTFLILQTWIL
ncbi:MAG: AEC family transporter [Clostridia bacterium]|nr:AEC family transporter [Clostridia bacterium]